jgi:hypothetical protein
MPVIVNTRQVHLDFHTAPQIPDVGRDFDARAFAAAMKRAQVNSVTVFAKCHHGQLYYQTAHPARHPGMKPGLDLLGEQVEALHREGIRAPIYLSVQCDEFAANTHPEWIAKNPDGSPVGYHLTKSPFPFFQWQILDLSSAYQDYLGEQIAEVLKRFHPVDGIFLDMCWDQPSCSHAAVRAMAAKNLDPRNEDHRKRHAHATAHAYMDRYSAQIRAANPDAGIYFNSRPMEQLADEHPWQAQVEIEALPSGGWGYLYFPKNVRWGRRFGKPYLGMTARFHKSWADFGGLKPEPALEYETAQMLAHGAHCSIGDQLHPRGTLDGAAYELIGRIYGRVAAREPWTVGAAAETEVGVFMAANAGDPALATAAGVTGSDDGLTRLFTQLKVQFDFIAPGEDLSRFTLVVVPDSVRIDGARAAALDAFVAAGGRVLATGWSGLDEKGMNAWPGLGIDAAGPSPFTTTYARYDGPLAAGIPVTDHVLYDRGVRVAARAGTVAHGRVVEPYFERAWNHFSSHCQTPGAEVSAYPLATVRTVGKGLGAGVVAYVPFPLFAGFGQHGNGHLRQFARNLLDLLLPRPLIRSAAPSGTEITVMRQGAGAGHGARRIVHLLHYSPERRTPTLDLVEDVVPLHQVQVALRADAAPASCILAPEGTALPVSWADGYASVTIPVVRGHAMVVFA